MLCAAFGFAGIAGSLATEQQPADPNRNYVLAAEDLIEVTVFQEEDLTTRARISHDGTINFPLIGAAALGGKTVQQAAELIRSRLGERFLVNPQVNLTVQEYSRKLFTVLGQVQRPGTYRFPERQALDLVQVIGMAGGYTRIADASRITVKRRTAGKETVFRVDGKRLARDEKAEAFAVEPGDLITVGERLF
jgi:protein involved in polysaccharide export with SLBB domain